MKTPTVWFALILCSVTLPSQAGATNTALATSPISINFGNQKVNVPGAGVIVTVANIGASPVTILKDSIEPASFSVFGPSLPLTIPAGSTAAFTVVFTPRSAGISLGSLTFSTSGSDNANSTTPVTLTGTGLASDPVITVTPMSIAFGNQSVADGAIPGVTTCAQPVSISNGGSKTVTIVGANTTGPYSVVSFQPTSLTPRQTYSFGVSYSPTPPGQADAGVLTISFDVLSPATIVLTGTGVQTHPSADPKIPLIDMGGNRTYLGYNGGLFDGNFPPHDNGCNNPPADHAAVGESRAALVQPLDSSGAPSAAGQIVLLSIGLSNTVMEWCGAGGLIGSTMCGTASNPSPADVKSFMNQTSDPSIKPLLNSVVTVINGAISSQPACAWTYVTGPPSPACVPSNPPQTLNDYDAILDYELAPNGLTEKQVEALWLKEADVTPAPNTPHLGCSDCTPDAQTLEGNLGLIVRAAKIRYPNLRIIVLSSRIFGGFATPNMTREPYAYEGGYAVKWLIRAQINQMRGGGIDPVAGDLDYNSVAPWIVWERLADTASLAGSTYTWANSSTSTGLPYANSDGVIWPDNSGQDYFESNGQHPDSWGICQVATLLLNYFSRSDFTKGWFLALPNSPPTPLSCP
jgi:hypothetical protein